MLHAMDMVKEKVEEENHEKRRMSVEFGIRIEVRERFSPQCTEWIWRVILYKYDHHVNIG